MTVGHSAERARLVEEIFDRWLPGAMFPSELLWLEQHLRRAEVEVLIECGRQDGVSTWTLARLLEDLPIDIQSIDFDDDRTRLEEVRRRLEGMPVTCVSGDVHEMVPRLLRDFRGRRIAVVQDGPKGWEGMATVLAAALDDDVVLVAQHNLHIGHVSRTVFEMLSQRPAFLELGDDPMLTELRDRELQVLASRAPNRALDHSSLGVLQLDDPGRAHLSNALRLVRHRMIPWDPITVRKHWAKGDDQYCQRVRSLARFTPARFKKR